MADGGLDLTSGRKGLLVELPRSKKEGGSNVSLLAITSGKLSLRATDGV
jgi:hypothetical protein